MSETGSPPTPPSTAARIVTAAMELLAEGGRERVSTRAVCEAAGVQAPTIYRLFGSMDGLFDAVAHEGFLVHQRGYRRAELTEDPVADLRAGWDQHVAFGLANPYLYAVMYGRADPSTPSYAAVTANEGLHFAIHRVAEAGLLKVDEEYAALSMTAAGVGATFTLLATPEADRAPDTSARLREGFLASIIAEHPEAPDAGVVGTAAALNALLGTSRVLHPAEVGLLRLWLNRLARPHDVGPDEPAA